MALKLKIDNETSLPDGGPLGITVSGKRGIDIGRDSHLDWTLPDPTRFVSSKHAEIRYKDGGYWLHDVSTNGTFLNGGDHRMQAPHRLRHGDRFTIGHYIIVTALDADQSDDASAPSMGINPPPPQDSEYQELWANPQQVAPPIDRGQLRGPRERPAPVNPDFLDWAADVPHPSGNPADGQDPARRTAPIARPEDDMSWAVGRMSGQTNPPPPVPEIPSPRRPLRVTEPSPPWDADRSLQSNREHQSAAVMPNRAPAAAAQMGRDPAAAMSESGGQFGSPDIFLRRLAQAAGMPEDMFSRKDPIEFADQLGVVMRIVVNNLMQLLNARHQAKLLARSSSHTMIQAFDNNPLKFSPNAEDALRIMFGPSTRSYLDARSAVEQGFEDLKRHQIKTYSAMQHALTALIGNLDPQSIDRDTVADQGIAALVTSRKAKLWDAYVSRWQAQVCGEDAGLIDRFMLLFAEHYDRDGG